MKLSWWHLTALLAFLLLLHPAQSSAQLSRFARRPSTIEHDLGSDHFATGRDVEVNRPVAGDLLTAGGTLGLNSSVAGDTTAAGATVRLNGAVARDAYIAGGQVYLDGHISGNARIACGNVNISSSSRVDGNLSVAAGQVYVNGPVGGYLQAAAGTVYINAPVGGDVEATGRIVELGPNARITGKLMYRSRQDLKQDPAAQVSGGVERRPFPAAQRRAGLRALAIAFLVIWMLGVILASIVLLLLLSRFFDRVVTQFQGKPGLSFLLGFAILVCVPAAAFILLFTVIGIPLSLLCVAAYLLVWGVGYIVAAMALGASILRPFHAGALGSFGWRAGAAILGIIILAVLGSIPLVGGLIVLIALTMGIGAIILQLHHELSPSATP